MKTKGWKNVFKFTYLQTIKAKSFIVSTIILTALICLMIAGINFLPLLSSDGDSDIFSDSNATDINIKTMYVLNESGIDSITFDDIADMGITVNQITADKLEKTTSDIKASTSASVLLHITGGDGFYSILMSRPESEEVINSGDCDNLLSLVSTSFDEQRLVALGVDKADLDKATAEISSDTTVAGEKPVSVITELMSTVLPMVSSLILFMFIFIYGQMVAQSIATEKTSRVMELLLTSIRPLAVIIGKVLAMGLVALTQIVIMGTVSGVTFAACAPFGIIGKTIGQLNSAAASGAESIAGLGTVEDVTSVLSNFNIVNLLLILLLFILGFLFYALIAGLIGATVSRMEDLNTAMQPLSIIGVLGFYLAYFPVGVMSESTGVNPWILLAHYLPISSPFSLPSAILLGEMQPAEIAISIAVLAVFVVLMAMLVAKVYESIILHSGNRLKIGDIFKIAKSAN